MAADPRWAEFLQFPILGPKPHGRELAALNAAAALTGSAILALALSEGRLDADEAFAAAQLDEIYQSEKWGEDPEALNRSSSKAAELAHIARFFRLCAG